MSTRLELVRNVFRAPSKHIPRPWLYVVWAGCALLAAVGNVLYLINIQDWGWWRAILMDLPLVWLFVEHLPSSGDGGNISDGPWGAP